MTVAVCLPTYNERETLEPIVRALGRVFAEHSLAARVLVVDDDARVRRALCALLRSSPGMSVVGEASSSRATFDADEALCPDIVLLDVLLPTAEEGFRVLGRLAATGRAVVALSIRDALRPAALAAGAVAFVDKYAGADALLDTMHQVAARSVAKG